MKKIYLVMVETIWNDGKTENEIMWAVDNEENAKRDCKQLQIDHNNGSYQTFHEIYYIQEVKFYEYY